MTNYFFNFKRQALRLMWDDLYMQNRVEALGSLLLAVIGHCGFVTKQFCCNILRVRRVIEILRSAVVLNGTAMSQVYRLRNVFSAKTILLNPTS